MLSYETFHFEFIILHAIKKIYNNSFDLHKTQNIQVSIFHLSITTLISTCKPPHLCKYESSKFDAPNPHGIKMLIISSLFIIAK